MHSLLSLPPPVIYKRACSGRCLGARLTAGRAGPMLKEACNMGDLKYGANLLEVAVS